MCKIRKLLSCDLDRFDRAVGGMLDFDFHLAILAVVSESATEAALVIQVESHAGINGQGIDVQANAACFSGIAVLDLVNALQLVHTINGAAGGATYRIQAI